MNAVKYLACHYCHPTEKSSMTSLPSMWANDVPMKLAAHKATVLVRVLKSVERVGLGLGVGLG